MRGSAAGYASGRRLSGARWMVGRADRLGRRPAGARSPRQGGESECHERDYQGDDREHDRERLAATLLDRDHSARLDRSRPRVPAESPSWYLVRHPVRPASAGRDRRPATGRSAAPPERQRVHPGSAGHRSTGPAAATRQRRRARPASACPPTSLRPPSAPRRRVRQRRGRAAIARRRMNLNRVTVSLLVDGPATRGALAMWRRACRQESRLASWEAPRSFLAIVGGLGPRRSLVQIQLPRLSGLLRQLPIWPRCTQGPCPTTTSCWPACRPHPPSATAWSRWCTGGAGERDCRGTGLARDARPRK